MLATTLNIQKACSTASASAFSSFQATPGSVTVTPTDMQTASITDPTVPVAPQAKPKPQAKCGGSTAVDPLTNDATKDQVGTGLEAIVADTLNHKGSAALLAA